MSFIKNWVKTLPSYLFITDKSAKAISGQIEGLNPDNYTGISSSLPNISIKK